MNNDIFTTGSGNIFTDLGFSENEAAELTLKSCLFTALQQVISHALETSTQAEMAERIGVDQPIVSKIMSDKMSGFSVQRIAGYLLRLHYDICLTARPSPRTRSGRVIPMNTKAAVNKRYVKTRA
jgi:predicted XRE-type DNA-binding protein